VALMIDQGCRFVMDEREGAENHYRVARPFRWSLPQVLAPKLAQAGAT
jgi:hypothetical protein